MRQSQLFTKTRREAPKDEVAKNAQLLIRAGYIHKEMAGVYSFLPLGLRVLNKVIQIIREEMNEIGGQEVHLTALQDPITWQTSGRWSDEANDTWFKTRLHGAELHGGGELGLANTHEEALAALMRGHITSYKDLPLYAYQFQTKFRNERRAKSGILRAREFLMKDLYSFSRTEEEFRDFYEQVAAAYLRIFKRVGLGGKTYRTFASGGSFSKYSDEFQTICPAGEDIIYLNKEKRVAVNKEVYTEEVLADLKLDRKKLKEVKAIEVGNIFPLGTKYSEALGLTYRDEVGDSRPVIMGSYGIGPGRVMGTVAEIFSDEAGLSWPQSVAPFTIHLIELPSKDAAIKQRAGELYQKFCDAGVEVLYDDRDLRAGEKFADSDLLGLPYRVVIGEKIEADGLYEVKNRASGEVNRLNEVAVLELTAK
ncbi:MAG: aminoacyl--tRNA ligase-related protein [Patescibacteria group bacterium]|nr:aminoacyl--tRNA ligase-related protein [Patescibacteria group bacterium]